MTSYYESPLSARYAGERMQRLFSSDNKFTTWRRLWIALAEAEQELGLAITDEQLEEMRAHVDDINYETARKREREVRHDVMSHVYAYGVQCPKAAPIIHLGATSCYVGDNTDIILMREALLLLKEELIAVIRNLFAFAKTYKDLPVLSFTHFQPAQPTTLGKRATLWINDFITDLKDLDYVLSTLALLGSKGTTGTQASFLTLFDNDADKVQRLDPLIAKKMGFASCVSVSGQTYARKTDQRVCNVLSGIAVSATKMATDLRLLQHMKEVEEPFEDTQIGSSAMAYKRNPMRCERICSLARYVITNALNPALTASAQWFERTLDDSANKRIAIPEGFLATDAVLLLCMNVTGGLRVNEQVIRTHLRAELPFMATETILMEGVKKGGDRQKLHERIRVHSMEAARRIKEEGKENDLLSRLSNDPEVPFTEKELALLTDADAFTGMSAAQTVTFLEEEVKPLLEGYQNTGIAAKITV